MDKNDLMKYLVEEAELLDHWLEYNGICGFTEDIKDVIEAAFNVDLED